MPAVTTPDESSYLDEKATRDEFTRVVTVCRDCRRCTDLCGTFPTLFDLLDSIQDHDPGRLTPATQDQVADACFQCGRCVAGCPYSPDLDDLAVDVPGLVLRLAAMRRATGQVSMRERMSTWLLTRRSRLGRVVRGEPGSIGRRIASAVSDLSARRVLGANVRPTFSERHRRRRPAPDVVTSTNVVVFPTCFVEHEAPQVGEALVRVYERNGIACDVTAAGCCGAPSLHAGDVDEFARVARRNVAILADEIRRGAAVIVPQPACLQVLTQAYPAHLGDPDAEFVARHVSDAVEFLMGRHDTGRHDTGGRGLDTAFEGEVPGRVSLHDGGPESTSKGSAAIELLELTGALVTTVRRPAGTGFTWGWRTAHVDASLELAHRLADDLVASMPDLIVGDDQRANTAIFEQIGVLPLHPLEVIDRAYGAHLA